MESDYSYYNNLILKIKGSYTVGVAVLTVNQMASASGGSTPSLPIKS